MEIFELRYFLEVAKFENIHRASESLNLSPGSLSKTIARLEEELQVNLFTRSGRNIRLTEQGQLLKLRAAKIILLEESVRLEVGGNQGQIKVRIAGPEVLLARYGVRVANEIGKRLSNIHFDFHACDEKRALDEVASDESHLAIVTSDLPSNLTAKILDQIRFVTTVGPKHPLYDKAKTKKPISIEEVLRYEFVVPNHHVFGGVRDKQSFDGWRDDKFSRRIKFQSSSLALIETLVEQGKALAYVPEYYAESIGALAIKMTDCPYSCLQKIKLVAHQPEDTGWINRLF
jgi:DNA-binding transcriptional LysR family regulator